MMEEPRKICKSKGPQGDAKRVDTSDARDARGFVYIPLFRGSLAPTLS